LKSFADYIQFWHSHPRLVIPNPAAFSRRVRNLLFIQFVERCAVEHQEGYLTVNVGRRSYFVFLPILPVTSQPPSPVIPSEMARFLPSRSLLRTSRATQSRNPSSIDRGAKFRLVPSPHHVDYHSETRE
jgi:hypothetical protein